MAFSGFEFFFFFILVPPLTVFEGGIEGVSVSGSPVVLWNLLIPIKLLEAAVWQSCALVATPEEQRE